MKVFNVMKSKRFLTVVVVVIAIIFIIHFLFFTKYGVKLTHTNMQQLSAYLKRLGVFGMAIGMLLVFLQTFFPFIPFVLIAGTNVAIFGFPWGFVVNYTMSCLGAIAAFLFSRYFAHHWVENKISHYPAVIQFNKRMESQGFFYVLLGRLIPVIPSSAISMGAGVTKVSFRQFLFGTLLGKLPIVFLESLIAHDLFHFKHYKGRLLILLLIFALLIYIGNLFNKKLTQKKTS